MNILLTTLHSKYSHASLALPSLAACCRNINGINLTIREYIVNEPREHILRLIMSERPGMIGFSCYIWNIEKTLAIAADIKSIAPDILILLGGPEVSFGIFELMHDNPAIDFVIKGEGEACFKDLVVHIARGGENRLLHEISNLFFRDGRDIVSGVLDIKQIQLDSLPSPFTAGLVDLGKPLIYYETSRGCPFSCAFCLSSLEGQVRSYSMERIRSDLTFLMERRIPQIKLVDRTFNYDIARAMDIWCFILKHNQGSHFHFEIAGELLNDEAVKLLKQVPEHTFRFEIGIQSASADVLEQVGRKSDPVRLFNIIRRLRSETSIELHLDLVAGLPGEDYQGFLASVQAVSELAPQEIQVEPLKVLKGSPMRDIAGRQDYRFSASPPYTILRNPWLDYDEICRITTIGRLLDLFSNHGGFTVVLKLLTAREKLSLLLNRMAVNAGNQQLSGFSTLRLYQLFYQLAETGNSADDDLLADALFFDFCNAEMPRKGKLPGFIADRVDECCWPGGRETPDKVEHGGRTKLFRFTFRRDYRVDPWREEPAEVTFRYNR